MATTKKKPPFDFIIDELAELEPRIKPMFGSFGLYIENKIVFILCKRESLPLDSGVWLATTGEHHASLQTEFPSMRSISIFGPGQTGWQVLPETSEDFEESVFRAIDLVKRGDPRIGKIPKSKIRKGGRTRATSKGKGGLRERKPAASAALEMKPTSKDARAARRPAVKRKPAMKTTAKSKGTGTITASSRKPIASKPTVAAKFKSVAPVGRKHTSKRKMPSKAKKK